MKGRLVIMSMLICAVTTLLVLPQLPLPSAVLSGRQAQFTLSPTSNPSTCLSEMNATLQPVAMLLGTEAAAMQAIAENSRAFKSYTAAGLSLSPVGASPETDYAVQSYMAPGCTSVSITSYDFNFISWSVQLVVAVSPSGSIVNSVTMPAVSWG